MENKSLVGSVFERTPGAPNRSPLPSITSKSTGFPPVKHRSQSAFARNRELRKNAQNQTNQLPVPPSARKIQDVIPAPVPIRVAPTSEEEMKRQISEENDHKIAGMTDEEIERERAEIVERFGAGIGDLLKKVREARQRQGSAKPNAEPDKDEKKKTAETSLDAMDETPIVSPVPTDRSLSRRGSVSPPPPALLPPGSRPSSRADRRLRFAELSPNDVHVYPSAPSSPRRKALALPPPDPNDNSTVSLGTFQPAKQIGIAAETTEEGTPEDIRKRFFPNAPADNPSIAWMNPGLPVDTSASSSLRFDLTGTPIPASLASTLPTHLGLHHHAEGTLAGYTLDDIFLLTRSTVPAQRATMLGVLAQIARKLRGLEKGISADSLESLRGQESELRKRILAAGIEAMNERGSTGARAVEVVWQCTAGWDIEFFKVKRVGFVPEEPSKDPIASLPLEQVLAQISDKFSARDLPIESLAQLLGVCHRISLVSNEAASQIVNTKSLVSGIVKVFLFGDQDHVNVAALHFLSCLAESSRANATAVMEFADSLLRFIAILPPQSPLPLPIAENLLGSTLTFYSTLCAYGLYSHIASSAMGPLSNLAAYVIAQPVTPSSIAIKQAWLELSSALITCAINPHHTTPPHDIRWSQIAGQSWQNDIMSTCTGLGGESIVWPLWAAAWRALSSWLEGARVNGVKGGDGERSSLLPALRSSFTEGSPASTVIQSAADQLGGFLESPIGTTDHVSKLSSLAEPLAAVLRLCAACIPLTHTPPSLPELPFGLPFDKISNICAKLVLKPIWDLDETKVSGRELSSLLAYFLQLSRRRAATKVDTWLAQTVSVVPRLLPGDHEHGQEALSALFPILTPELLLSRGEPAPAAIWEKHGFNILAPFLNFTLQGDGDIYIGPLRPTVESIHRATTLRVPYKIVPNPSSDYIPAGLPLAKDWVFSALDHLLRSSTSPVFKNLPNDWDASEVELVRASLLFAKVNVDVLLGFSLLECVPSREEVVFNCMKVFMLEHGQSQDYSGQEVFRDSIVSSLMSDLLDRYTPRSSVVPKSDHNLEQVAARMLGKSTPFYQYYSDLVGLYDAVSFSDPVFARLVVVPTSMRYPIDYRRLLWSDFSHVLKGLYVPLDRVIVGDVSDYLWPIERDNQVLSAYLRGLGKAELSGLLRLVATHHLACNVWPDLLPNGDDRNETGQKIFRALVTVAADEIVSDVVRYHQSGATILPPNCFEQKGAWQASRVKWLESWNAPFLERIRGLLN